MTSSRRLAVTEMKGDSSTSKVGGSETTDKELLPPSPKREVEHPSIFVL